MKIATTLEKQEVKLLKNHLDKFREYLKQTKDENIQRIIFRIEQS